MVGGQLGILGEHQGIDDVVQRLGDDRLDLFDVPAGAHARHLGPHAIHLIVVGPRHQEEELRITGLDTARRLSRPWSKKGRLNASVDDLAITVLSRSKNAAVRGGPSDSRSSALTIPG